ncbi:hypothetical protein [Alteribacillus sp. YIM 98480]|uniref:hypothetical protein n=1 Tax=Alteribacillus sp. YIM 98480 TaxID=2606599 RepID=UPI00131C1066|nr:hypothetical protein [Alteribacillus sp. YIM 98480]
MSVENAMVLPNGYGFADPQEHEPEVIGTCSGCQEEIFDYDEAFQFGDDLLHDENACAGEYIRKYAENVG